MTTNNIIGPLKSLGYDETQQDYDDRRMSIKTKGKFLVFDMNTITNPTLDMEYYYIRQKNVFKGKKSFLPPKDNHTWIYIKKHMQVIQTKKGRRKQKGLRNTLKNDPANKGKSSRFLKNNKQKEKLFECKYKSFGCPAIKWVGVGVTCWYIDERREDDYHLLYVVYENEHNHIEVTGENDENVQDQPNSTGNEATEENDNLRCDSTKSNQADDPGDVMGNDWLMSFDDGGDNSNNDESHNDDDGIPDINRDTDNDHENEDIDMELINEFIHSSEAGSILGDFFKNETDNDDHEDEDMDSDNINEFLHSSEAGSLMEEVFEEEKLEEVFEIEENNMGATETHDDIERGLQKRFEEMFKKLKVYERLWEKFKKSKLPNKNTTLEEGNLRNSELFRAIEELNNESNEQGPSSSSKSLITRHKSDDCLLQKDNFESEVESNRVIDMENIGNIHMELEEDQQNYRLFGNKFGENCWFNACTQFMVGGLLDHMENQDTESLRSELGQLLNEIKKQKGKINPLKVRDLLFAKEANRIIKLQSKPNERHFHYRGSTETDLSSFKKMDQEKLGQQDCKEFFTCLSACKEDWPDVFETFDCTLQQYVYCPACKTSTQPTESPNPLVFMNSTKNINMNDLVSREFNEPDRVEWRHEDGCGKRTEGQKYQRIKNIEDQEFIIFIVERLRQTGRGKNKKMKINKAEITITPTIDIMTSNNEDSTESGTSVQFEPIAIIYHTDGYTNASNSDLVDAFGHYMADILDRESNEWIRTSDDKPVEKIDFNSITKQGYIFLYKRKRNYEESSLSNILCKGKGKGKGKSSNQNFKEDELNVKSKEAMKDADMITLEAEEFLAEKSESETEEDDSNLNMNQEEGKRETEDEKEKKDTEFDESQLTDLPVEISESETEEDDSDLDMNQEEGKRETEDEKEKKDTEFDESQLTDLPILRPEMEAIIKNSLNSSEKTVLITAYKIPIHPSDVKTLLSGALINDNIINFYMHMIVARSKEDTENFRSVYAFTSFFYQKLMKGGYERVKRWIKKVDLFSHSLILIPVHLVMKGTNHWCLATIDMDKKTIVYYDSLGGNNNRALKEIASFLQQAHLAKKGSALDLSGWEQKNAKNIPQQKNGSDCGMFVCKFAEYLSRKAEFTFSHSNMPYFRKQMMYEISRNELLYPSKVPIRIKSPSPAKSPNHSNYTSRYGRVKHSWSEEQAQAYGDRDREVINSWPWYNTDRLGFDRKPFYLAMVHEPEKRRKIYREAIEDTQARIERMKAKQEKQTLNINIASLTWQLQRLQEEEGWF